MPRKTYTREFKLQALKMLTDQGLPVAEAARRLGVTEGRLRAWRTAAEEHGDDAFPGHGNPAPPRTTSAACRPGTPASGPSRPC